MDYEQLGLIEQRMTTARRSLAMNRRPPGATEDSPLAAVLAGALLDIVALTAECYLLSHLLDEASEMLAAAKAEEQ